MGYGLWHRWHKEDIVFCAIMGCTLSVYHEWIDYALRLRYSLYPFPFLLSLSGTHKRKEPHVLIKRNRIGVVSGNADLDTISSPNLYTWPVLHDISEGETVQMDLRT